MSKNEIATADMINQLDEIRRRLAGLRYDMDLANVPFSVQDCGDKAMQALLEINRGLQALAATGLKR